MRVKQKVEIMKPIDNLIDAVNEYFHKHGEYPKVVISREFWEEHHNEIAKLHNEGTEFEVREILAFRTFFIEKEERVQQIDTLADLKKRVDELFSEGKGHWKVLSMPPDANVFLPVNIFPVIPGQNPEDHILEYESIAGDPESEYIRFIIGDVK